MSYDRAALAAELSRDEGRRYRAYLDSVRKRSIGVGRNLDDVGIRAIETAQLGITLASVVLHGVTDQQIDVMLDNDIDAAERDLDRKLAWWRELDPVRQRVLLNMCFNMGIGNGGRGLTSFNNTLQAIRDHRWHAAASGMRSSKWARQVGARADRLATMIETGGMT